MEVIFTGSTFSVKEFKVYYSVSKNDWQSLSSLATVYYSLSVLFSSIPRRCYSKKRWRYAVRWSNIPWGLDEQFRLASLSET